MKRLSGFWLFVNLLYCIPLYADALDNLVEQKKIEQKQKKQSIQKQVALSQDIEDCEQAIAKAAEKMKELHPLISDKEWYVFNRNHLINEDGVIENVYGGHLYVNPTIYNFSSDGLFVRDVLYRFFFSWPPDIYIYTKDNNYKTGDDFKGNDFIYQKVGYYKYKNSNDNIISIPAFKATTYKITETLPETYLKNKNVTCCQYTSPSSKIFKDVGVRVVYENDPRPSRCITKKYPDGSNENFETYPN